VDVVLVSVSSEGLREDRKPVFEVIGKALAGQAAVLVSLTAVALLAVGLSACSSSSDPAGATVRRIVDELAAQRYGSATALYRDAEEVVLSPEAAPGWRRALEHEDATVRQWAVDALSRIGEPEDLQRVERALDDPFRKVQEIAAEGLMRMAPERASVVFLERLGVSDTMAKAMAAQSLADMGELAAVPTIIDQLLNTSLDDGARDIMAQSLGRLGDPRAAPALVEVVLDEGSGLQLRRSAAEAVAMLPADETRDALRQMSQSEDTYIRDLAERLLRD
jgi:HEAT repeat protein